ncbi:hypothetical protein DM01DRAFT_1374173 [Hesseltinella vesiculosa]|uniref:Uncharacterized protein n=1 Tax=Hesseltinella vesiculosa TaxID=101127 RepID=A0A1X2GIS0_9FUNG|nr:hypothetical protein DM01DRAFT_1374173 [Hesseltinella vesiculosa]
MQCLTPLWSTSSHIFFEDDDDEYYINISSSLGYPNSEDLDYGIHDGTIVFTFEEIRDKVFEPAVTRVLNLIQRQLDSSGSNSVDAIFMVGGFGMSTYLQHLIAVGRDAVYFGMNPHLVTQRVNRRTYGLDANLPFNSLHDPQTHRIDVRGKSYCRDRFSVYVNKGDAIGVDESVTKDIITVYPNDFSIVLCAYDGDGPAPRMVGDARVKEGGTFRIQMPSFPDVTSGTHIPGKAHMYFGLTKIKIEVEIRDQCFTFTSRMDPADDIPGGLHCRNTSTFQRHTPLPTPSTPKPSHSSRPSTATPPYQCPKPDRTSVSTDSQEARSLPPTPNPTPAPAPSTRSTNGLYTFSARLPVVRV